MDEERGADLTAEEIIRLLESALQEGADPLPPA